MSGLENEWGPLIKSAGSKSLPEGFIKQLRDMTARNYHTEAYLFLAKELKDKKMIRVFEAVIILAGTLGYRPVPPQEFHKLYQMLMARAEKVLSPESYEAVRQSL